MNSNERDILNKYRKISNATVEEIHAAVRLGSKYLDLSPAQMNLASARIEIYEKVDAMFDAMFSDLDRAAIEANRVKTVQNTTEAPRATNTEQPIHEYGHAPAD